MNGTTDFRLCLLACALTLSACSPRAPKAEPRADLARAWSDYRSGDFSAAVRIFDGARANSKEGTEDHLMALYGLATTWDLRRPDENRDLAVTYYGKILSLAPHSDLAAWSLFAIARMKHLPPVGRDPDYPSVRAAYQEVIDRFPNHPAAGEAFLYQQSAWVATLTKSDAQTARTALENYLQTHPETKYRSALYNLLSSACQTLDQPRDGIAFAIKALDSIEIDPTNPNRDKAAAYWLIATEAEFRVGDFDTAGKYYNLLIQEYPSDQRVFPAKLALERMDGMKAKIGAELKNSSTTR